MSPRRRAKQTGSPLPIMSRRLERHIGQGVFQAVLANNSYPSKNKGERTHYVLPVARERSHPPAVSDVIGPI